MNSSAKTMETDIFDPVILPVYNRNNEIVNNHDSPFND